MKNVSKDDVHTHQYLSGNALDFQEKDILNTWEEWSTSFTIDIVFTTKMLSVRVAMIACSAMAQIINAYTCLQMKRYADRNVAVLF